MADDDLLFVIDNVSGCIVGGAKLTDDEADALVREAVGDVSINTPTGELYTLPDGLEWRRSE